MLAMKLTIGPNILAILVKKGTQYACNIETGPWVTWLWFLDESRENKFSMIASLFGPLWKRLQAYMFRFGCDIASIFSPLGNWYCIHIRSFLLSTLQAYLVTVIKIIATIFGIYFEYNPEYDFIHISLIGHWVRLICVHDASKSENKNNIGCETELLGHAACSFDVITNFLSGWHNNFRYLTLLESFQKVLVVFQKFKTRSFSVIHGQ